MIREARFEDLDSLVKLAERAASTSVYRHFKFNPMRARQIIAKMMASQRCVALVAEHGEAATGMLLGFIDKPFDGAMDGQIATDFMTYAERAGDGARLVKAFRDWANQKGVDFVLVATSAGVETERTHELYSRLGNPVGGIYLMEGGGDERSSESSQESI